MYLLLDILGGFTLTILQLSLLLYLINSKFEAKRKPVLTTLLTGSVLLVVMMVLALLNITSNFVFIASYTLVLLGHAFLFRKGAPLQKLFWVLIALAIFVVSLVVGTMFGFLVLPENVGTFFMPSLGWFLVNVVTALVQGLATFLLARTKTQAVKMSPLIMGILVVVPLLSCLVLAELAQFGTTEISYESKSELMIVVAFYIAIIVFALFVLYARMTSLTAKSIEQERELQRKELDRVHFEEIRSLYNETRTWRHDFRNHLSVISGYASSGQYDNLNSYLANIDDSAESIELHVRSGNDLLDVIINTKMSRAKAAGIRFTAQIDPVPQQAFDPVTFTSLIGNLLDNAIEACERMTSMSVQVEAAGVASEPQDITAGNVTNGTLDEALGNVISEAQDVIVGEVQAGGREDMTARFIDLRISDTGSGQLIIAVSNSTDPSSLVSSQAGNAFSRFITSKKEGDHGIGLQQIDSIVKEYGGTISRNVEDSVFETLILLPLPYSS